MKQKLLTEDEKEFIALNSDRFSCYQIADMLGRSPSGIRSYILRNNLNLYRGYEVSSLDYPYMMSEKEVLVWRLMSEGLTNEEIKEILCIATSTLKTHINNIYSKLGLTGSLNKSASVYRVKAVLLYQKAVREGLFEE